MVKRPSEITALQGQAGVFDPQFCRKWVHRLGPEARREGLWFQEIMLDGEQSFHRGEGIAGACGPVEVVCEGDQINLRRLGHSYYLLPWRVEPDLLAFKRCSARGVLVVENWSIACRLAELDFPGRAQLLILCAGGVPRFNARLFLHRLTKELGLPVYLLTANDPWGYFIFSVLRRGTILSHVQRAETRIDEVRYLGIRAGDYELIRDRNPEVFVIGRSPEVRTRLRCMRKYTCFRGAAWQKEFDRYEKQGGFVDLEAFTAARGGEWLADLVQTRIDKQDWLS